MSSSAWTCIIPIVYTAVVFALGYLFGSRYIRFGRPRPEETERTDE